jgi:hypothetical protein
MTAGRVITTPPVPLEAVRLGAGVLLRAGVVVRARSGCVSGPEEGGRTTGIGGGVAIVSRPGGLFDCRGTPAAGVGMPGRPGRPSPDGIGAVPGPELVVGRSLIASTAIRSLRLCCEYCPDDDERLAPGGGSTDGGAGA